MGMPYDPPPQLSSSLRTTVLSAEEDRLLDVYRNGSDEARYLIQQAVLAAIKTTRLDYQLTIASKSH